MRDTEHTKSQTPLLLVERHSVSTSKLNHIVLKDPKMYIFFCWLVYVCGFWVYIYVLAGFCIKIQYLFFIIDSASSCPESLPTWSKLASLANVPYEVLSQ